MHARLSSQIFTEDFLHNKTTYLKRPAILLQWLFSFTRLFSHQKFFLSWASERETAKSPSHALKMGISCSRHRAERTINSTLSVSNSVVCVDSAINYAQQVVIKSSEFQLITC